MVNFLIFGPPGSGKGTQSVKLAEKFNLMHLSTGDMLRAEIAAGTDLGRRMSSIMSKGELVPDEVVIEMIATKIDNTKGKAGFLFDGFPRTVAQTEALEKMLNARDMKIDSMLVLDVDHDRHPRDARLLRRADGQRIDVESAGGEQPGDAGEHAGTVLDEHGDRVQLVAHTIGASPGVSCGANSGPRMMSSFDEPAGTIGYTFSRQSVRKSITTGS